jgi:hypothetical protein
MESSVFSFALTVERQLRDVEDVLAQIDAHDESIGELDIQDLEVDDPALEALFVGTKVKVLLQDVDRVRWRQDLIEDRDRLRRMLAAARQVNAGRDAKLGDLKKVIRGKIAAPINSGNRKIVVFTAFAETAHYLYDSLSGWAAAELGLQSACSRRALPAPAETTRRCRSCATTIVNGGVADSAFGCRIRPGDTLA